MVVNGFLPISDFQLQEGGNASQNGRSCDEGCSQAGDFSALLFLILGTPQIAGTPVTGDAETTAHPAAEFATSLEDPDSVDVGSEITGPQTRTIGAAAIDGAFMQPGPAAAAQVITQSDANQVSGTPAGARKTGGSQGESNAVPVTPDSGLWHGVTLQPQDARGDTASSPLARSPGEDIPTGNSILESSELETNPMGKMGIATVETAGAELRSVDPMHHGGRSIKLPEDIAAANRTNANAGAEAIQVKSGEVESSASYARAQGLGAYARDGMGSGVSNSAREHASPLDGGLKLGGPLQPQADGAADRGALSQTIHLHGETMSANLDQGEQGSFFQQGRHEPPQGSAGAPFDVLWHDGASIQSARVTDGARQTAARAVDWRPLIDHVAGEINGHIRIGKSEAVIQLDPPELGKLQIDLRFDGDKLEARILAENHESGKLIETHLPELRLALAERRIEHVDVRVDAGNWGSARGDSQQGQRREAGDERQAAHDNGGVARNNSEIGEPARHQPTARGAGRVSMWA